MTTYPTKKDLKRIEGWQFAKSEDVDDFLDFIKSILNWPDWGFIRKNNRLELHTGGWSGNEEIIDALKMNYFFWFVTWQIHRVGGHFYFDLRPFYRKTFWVKK